MSSAKSRGQDESEKLQVQVEEQLTRLLTQLQDLETYKEDLDDDYESIKKDTLQQLREFKAYLTKIMEDQLSLKTEFDVVQLAIQAAVSEAFHTPEVLKMFAKKDKGSLRQTLTNLNTALKLGKISKEGFTQQTVEILSALKKLGEPLSSDEEQFLNQNRSVALKEFEKSSNEMGSSSKANVVSGARKDNLSSQRE